MHYTLFFMHELSDLNKKRLCARYCSFRHRVGDRVYLVVCHDKGFRKGDWVR